MSNDKALVSLTIYFTDPQKPPKTEVMECSVLNDFAGFELLFNLRNVRRFEVVPMRRPLLDVNDIVRDAERLANEEK